MNTGSERPPNHFCPGCGSSLAYSPRTPLYYCGQCLKRATDVRGNAIQFVGIGAEWSYRDGHGPEMHASAIDVACLIDGRTVIVHEARQGGPIAEAVLGTHLRDLCRAANAPGLEHLVKNLTDLTNEQTLDEVVANSLVRPGRTLR
jgi:hypothetical protein